MLDFPRGKIFVPRYSSVETTSETILPFNFCGKKIKGAKIANSHFRHHSKRVVRRSTSLGFNRSISDPKNAVMATPARLCYNGKHQSSRMRAARRSLIAGITSGITNKKVCRKFGVASPIATTLENMSASLLMEHDFIAFRRPPTMQMARDKPFIKYQNLLMNYRTRKGCTSKFSQWRQMKLRAIPSDH